MEHNCALLNGQDLDPLRSLSKGVCRMISLFREQEGAWIEGELGGQGRRNCSWDVAEAGVEVSYGPQERIF